MIKIYDITCNLAAENTYIICDEQKRGCIIDPGMSNEVEHQRVIDLLRKEEITLDTCLLTHFHFDHIWGLQFIYDIYHPTVIGPRLDKEQLPSFTDQLTAFGLPAQMGHEIDVPIELLEPDAKEISVGSFTFKILEVPGHSPAHIAFYEASEDVVFSGDALFQGGIGRTDLWGGDYDTLIHSIKTELLTLPKETTVYPGHGPATTVGDELYKNPYL